MSYLQTVFLRVSSRISLRVRVATLALPMLLLCGAGTAFAAGANGTVFNAAIPGEFSVSSTGAASYSIPIEVPPGIGGMAPQLSLNFSSQAGNGLLGVGGSLGGLSAITRCPATLDQDGLNDGVDFDSNDQWCLDGQRLKAVTNTGCTGGTEYRTEIDTYARVCAYGTAGLGPTWFKVWTKAGQIAEYANTTDSRIEAQGRSDVLVWALNRVSDTAGNYMKMTYYEDNASGEYYITGIDYTGNTDQGMAPLHSVLFIYEERPDQVSGWIGGTITNSRVYMTGVRVYTQFAVVSDYRLSYETSSTTARSRLASLTHCTGTGLDAECGPATTLGWTETTKGYYQIPNKTWDGLDYESAQYAQAIDINGDGKTDIAYCTSETSYWQILISNSSLFGFDTPIATSMLCAYYQYVLPIDYDSDGLMDLLFPGFSWQVLRSTGAGFNLINTGIVSTGWDNKPVVMDINGDGRQDLILAYGSQLVIRINNGNGFNAAVMSGVYPINWDNWHARFVIDYDGDGRMDLMVPYLDAYWYPFHLSSAGSYSFEVTFDIPFNEVDVYRKTIVADVNGDRYQDIVKFNNGNRVIYLNHGGSFQQADTQTYDIFWPGWELDYNSDGKMDIIMPGEPGSPMATTWHVLQSTGTGFTTIDTSYSSQALYAENLGKSGDYNGDGHIDLALTDGNTGNLIHYLGSIPDLLATVDNGTGGTITFMQRPLTDSSVYTKGATPGYPQQGIQAPLYVVSAVSVSNGVGGTNTRQYTYADARVDLRGRGFLGFGTMTAVDTATQISTTTTYSQTFPYTGRVTAVDSRFMNAAAAFKTVTNSWNSTNAGGYYQVYLGSSVEKTYELDGTLVSTLTSSSSSFDAYGNPGRVSVTSAGGGVTYTTVTENTYDNDSVQWHLGRLLSATVTRTGPSGSATRTSAFEYDATTGFVTAESIEPNDPQLLLRTVYTYDGFGNKTSVTVSDSGSNEYPITTATSTTSYDYAALASTGIYTVTHTNAKGHVETQVIDAQFGKPLSLTGPNGLTTQWQYDGFGRQITEIRADGTQTTLALVWCDSSCAGVVNAVYKATSETSGAAPVSVYYDSLGRELRSESLGLDGTGDTAEPIYKDTQYNALGQITRVSRPYFAGDTPQWADYLYDALGRVWKETAPDGGITETAYNGLSTSTRRYSVNDAYDQTTSRITDVEGNPVQVIDAGGRTTLYEYDPFGNLTRVTDPANNSTAMVYDLRGRKASMDDPDMGHWEYKYDALGQLRWQKDAKDQTMTMTYDVLGRMTSRVAPEGTSTWAYDQPGTKGIGKPWKVIGADGYTETYTYDTLGRPSRTTQVLSGSTFNTTTTYDSFGRLYTLIYPNGFQLRHGYNAQGNLDAISNAANASVVYWRMNAQSPDGQIASETLGNGLASVRTIDPASGRLLYLGTYGGTTNVQMLSYQYDALGNLMSRSDSVQSLSESFQYDAYNRLTQTTIDGVGSKTWSYDDLGNITSKDGYTDYAYGSAGSKPHAVTVARGKTYSYDANGSMQSGAGRTITWNSANLPTRIVKGSTSADFSYAPDGTRYQQVAVSGGVSRTVRYIGKLYEQITKNGVVTHKNYLHAGGRVVAVREVVNSTVTMKYLHQDHLGSTDVVTGSSGQVLERQSFDAFGTRRVATSWAAPLAALSSQATTRGFTGHEQLDDLGLIHMNGRVYDPVLGRFLSADPIVQSPGEPQTLNRYSYVGNNPLSRVDPSGYGWLSKVWNAITGAVKSIVSAVVNVVKEVISNPVVQAVAAIAVAPWAGFYIGSTLGLSTAAGYAISGFTAGFIASGGSLQAGVLGAATGLAFYGVGNLAQTKQWGEGATALAHATVGGTSNAVMGGSFREGFLSGGFTSLASPRIGTMPGGRTARVVAAAVVGGTASELGGGKFANGAQTSAFAYLFSSAGTSPAQGGSSGLGRAALDVVGKIWALPNTIIGLAYGGAGHVLGWMMGTNPSISFANNAIQFENNPLMASAMTFGNVIVYGTDPVYFQPGSQRGQYTLGYEEMQHTYQAQVLGPLYFPGHIVSGATGLLMDRDWHGSSAFLEVGPHSRNPRPWP